MRRVGTVLVLMAILLVPTSAFSQSSRIILLDTFGNYKKGENIFVFGQIAQVSPDLYIVTQIINPNGDLCQIQQLKPLSDGNFITDPIPLTGKICGLAGKYEVKVFYGDYTSSSSFNLQNEKLQEKSSKDYLSSAISLIESKISSAKKSQTISGEFETRFSDIKNTSDVSKLRDLYSDLFLAYPDESDILNLDAKTRPAIETALATTKSLVSASKLDSEAANKIDKQTAGVAFYAAIGDTKSAVKELSDIYVSLVNADPQKSIPQKQLNYEELNQLLLNLMTKSNSIMSRPVKEEIGFIFARGTGPVYSDDLTDLVNLLTEARLLDTTLKKEDNLSRLIRTEWGSLRESLLAKETLAKFLGTKSKIDKLYDAALLLRNLDKVDKFVSSDDTQNSALAKLIKPKLDSLMGQLASASTPSDIVDLQQDIIDMKNVIEISSRISSTIGFAKNNNVNPKIVDSFQELLDKVKDAQTVDDILKIVSDYDNSIKDLREKRSPLSTLKFEYEKLKSKAELQSDYESLNTINNALKIINTAIEIEKGNPTINKIDKIEVLLNYYSTQSSVIGAKLDSYTKDAYKIRASEILQRAKSLENLVSLGERHNKFLPGYTDFTSNLKTRLDKARNLVVQKDLDAADTQIRDLFAEWQQVSGKYTEDPYGSESGYSLDEIKRIEYRKKINELTDFVTTFYNPNFDSEKFIGMTDDLSQKLDVGNFEDAEKQLKEIRSFVSDQIESGDKKILFDISYNPISQTWVMNGAVDKDLFDKRENLYVTIYDMKGNQHSTLKFSDTKDGDFYTQWFAPTDPGLYVVKLQWRNAISSQIADVAEKPTTTAKTPPPTKEYTQNVDLARQYENLQNFIKAFGGSGYSNNKAKFDPVISGIKDSLHDKDSSSAKSKIKELQSLIERYMPTRSKAGVLDAYMNNGNLYLSGALSKTVDFPEDVYVDIFDESGQKIDEIYLKDNSAGHFNQVIPKSYGPGVYVAQLEYHDLIVSDFFRIE
ncbi:MAG: hypothetical protein EB164_00880 [Thaumarchaeota archaeon]|nr:hypothetical protein [Nitrososphaerota archaeon]